MADNFILQTVAAIGIEGGRAGRNRCFYHPGGVYEITVGFRQEDSREENKQAGGISW